MAEKIFDKLHIAELQTRTVPSRKWSVSVDTQAKIIMQKEALLEIQYTAASETKLWGIPVIFSRDVPENEVHIVDDEGTKHKIVNIED